MAPAAAPAAAAASRLHIRQRVWADLHKSYRGACCSCSCCSCCCCSGGGCSVKQNKQKNGSIWQRCRRFHLCKFWAPSYPLPSIWLRCRRLHLCKFWAPSYPLLSIWQRCRRFHLCKFGCVLSPYPLGPPPSRPASHEIHVKKWRKNGMDSIPGKWEP